MPISFSRIPASLRTPLFWAEVDASQAGYLAQSQPACLLGHMSTGTADEERPYLVSSAAQAALLFGPGSMLADMVRVFRLNDPTGELYAVAVPEATGTKAVGTVTFAGDPTVAGLVAISIGGTRYAIAVSAASTPTTLAQALEDAVTADPLACCTAEAAAGQVTLTARHPGVLGNTVLLALNARGVTSGEVLPDGLTCVLVPFATGTGDPDVADSLTALADIEYDFVACPWSDDGTTDAIRDAYNDAAGRWSWQVQLYGGVYSARAGTAAELVTFAASLNDPHLSILGVPAGTPSPAWKVAAAYCGLAAVAFRADPARPLQTLPLVGIDAAPRGARWSVADRNTLLYHGIATTVAGADDVVRVDREVTTYQTGPAGQADPSYLDATTCATLQWIIRRLRNAILTKFPRMKLANDGTHFGIGNAIVTPSIIRGELVAQYSEMESLGMVENIDAFKKFLIVERDVTDPNRVNVLLPPDLVNQLRVFAALVQFRLQFSTATAVAA